jgi:cyanophycinase
MSEHTPGPLALVGGDELRPGNEDQDRRLVDAAGGGPAFVLATAAGRQRPQLAVETARSWFANLGLGIEELPAVRRRDLTSPAVASRAAEGRLFYLVGGDAGLVPATLAGTPVWEAVLRAWRGGAALAGSSAGAMALGAWTLLRDRRPGDVRRRFRTALGVVPRVAVVPHLDTFGRGWMPSVMDGAREVDALPLGIDERSAALWHDGVWRACGPGSVTVFDSEGRERRFGAGDAIDGLPQPAGPATDREHRDDGAD